MKIELKKVKIHDDMSEETTCFSAELYINGKCVGYAKNSGNGGCTDYHNYGKEGQREVIQDAEQHFNSLPKVKEEKYNFEYQPSLEYAIDEEIEKYLEKKEQKKMLKNFEKGICYGSENSYHIVSWKHPIQFMLRHPQGKGIIEKKIKELKVQGETILNTNLGELINA